MKVILSVLNDEMHVFYKVQAIFMDRLFLFI